MPNLKKVPVLKVIGIIWIIFASLYVVYGEYQRVKVLVAQRAYNSGIRDSVIQLIEQSQSCQPIPVNSGDVRVELIAVNCLTQGSPEGEPSEQ